MELRERNVRARTSLRNSSGRRAAIDGAQPASRLCHERHPQTDRGGVGWIKTVAESERRPGSAAAGAVDLAFTFVAAAQSGAEPRLLADLP